MQLPLFAEHLRFLPTTAAILENLSYPTPKHDDLLPLVLLRNCCKDTVVHFWQEASLKTHSCLGLECLYSRLTALN